MGTCFTHEEDFATCHNQRYILPSPKLLWNLEYLITTVTITLVEKTQRILQKLILEAHDSFILECHFYLKLRSCCEICIVNFFPNLSFFIPWAICSVLILLTHIIWHLDAFSFLWTIFQNLCLTHSLQEGKKDENYANFPITKTGSSCTGRL